MLTRFVKLAALGVALLVAGTSARAALPARPDDTKLDGSWKLVVLPFGEDDFAILNLSTQDGKTGAKVVDAQQSVLGRPKVKETVQKGDDLKITLEGPAGDTTFEAKINGQGQSADKILGSFYFRGQTFPARLEKTKDSKVAALKRSPLIAKYSGAANERDPKSKVKQLEELIRGNHAAPNSHLLYSAMLNSAEEAGVDAQKVGDTIKQWREEAKPYGTAWSNEVTLKALHAIAASKSFAKLSLALAQDLDKGISDQALEQKTEVVRLLANAARVVGMADLATETDARLAKLNLRLDEEYHHKVPPFKPTPFAGRTKSQANGVVMMEIFTGAECGPCVAADVAFDALLGTYKPTEFIGLQYHLHIPGPDPLTNSETETRRDYYKRTFRGTPSTYFNGQSDAGGGGGMDGAQVKYKEFRSIIDKGLEATTGVQIDLSATRTGDEIKIVASAQLPASRSQSQASGKDNQEDKVGPYLRLALTESSIRYVGGNKLRFHHNVVRALPGGARGKELVGGAGKFELTLSVAKLKRQLESYLSGFEKSARFPNPLPEIKLDDLAVVAFVQDDVDKNILHAVSVPVKPANP
jgi:hypothetical protein